MQLDAGSQGIERRQNLYSAAEQPVQTPRTGPTRAQPEEKEAVEHRQLPSVQDRPESPRSVCTEISYGHFARQNKGNGRREQSENDEGAAECFEHARRPKHGSQLGLLSPEPAQRAEEFLPAMLRYRETHH